MDYVSTHQDPTLTPSSTPLPATNSLSQMKYGQPRRGSLLIKTMLRTVHVAA
jgi:hypothetical protein